MKWETLPPLRKDINVFPATLGGRQVFVISDPLGLLPEPYVLPGEHAPLLRLFDGKHSIRDLQLEMMHAQGNRLVMREEAERFVVEMEERFLLDTEKYRRALERVVEEYSLLPSRPPSHAGTAYPAGREEAEEFVKKILGEGERGAVPENVAALVVPHIDLRVGGPAYGVAYSAVRNMDVDSVLLLCTGHYLGEDLFCLTRKDFETPFGVVKTDREAVDFLWRGKGIAPSDFPFRFEHSVEFQVLFLSYVFRRKDFAVVPILCGNFSRFLDVASRASQIPAVALFLTRLRKILSSPGKRWLVVAGVDLSHVGPKFGHRDPAKFMEYQFREHDRVLLDALERGDPEGFFGEVKKVGDRYNVCGFSSLALLLELFEGFRGKTLHYDVWYDTPTLSAVSFAASILHRGREG